jgi:C-lobe and N-lobe beta barrels of Tf-binding protein B
MHKNLLRLASSLAALLVAGCGGGGGGGGGGTTPAPNSTLQAPNTTKTYSVNSVAASVASSQITGTRMDPAGGGSTINASTDGNGNLTSLSFNVQTPSGTFTNTYNSFIPLSASQLNLNNFTQALQAANTTAGANGVIGSLLASAGNTLNYAGYGVWATNDTGTAGRLGFFSLGNPTPTMPVSGTATYNGTTFGTATSSSGAYGLEGTVQLAANFGTGTVTTNIANIQTQQLGTNATSSLPNMSGSATIAGTQYSGTLAGGSLTGTSTGTFYGPNASETGGTWRVTGGGVAAIGSYGAKQ